MVALLAAIALGLSLRKPGDDLALLDGATAVLIASTLHAKRRSARWLLGLLCALGALAGLLDRPSPFALAVVVLAAAASLVAAAAAPDLRTDPQTDPRTDA